MKREFKIGDRVRVRKGEFINCSATIMCEPSYGIVDIKYDDYWHTVYTKDLELINPTSLNVIQVVFKNNNLPYSFLNDIEDLEIGDKVVVDTRYGYEIATVKSFNDDKNATKMVVCKINTKEFEEKRNRINKELENEKQRNIRKATLLQKMKQVYASNSKLDEYKIMAKKNKEMAELLKDYEDVENGIWQPEEWVLPF